jgi:hypothetical protein
MKNLAQYITEEKKTYDFKIKIAAIELTNEILDRIEHALSTFELASLSKPKNLPIVEKNLDFPNFGACEVSLIMASLNYPCTDEQIRQALGTQARLPLSNIVVIPKNQPEELLRDKSAEDETTNKKSEPILTKELEEISGGQPLVGMQRVESLLKELETRRMEFAAKDIPQKAETTNSLAQGEISPVAKNANKIKGR